MPTSFWILIALLAVGVYALVTYLLRKDAESREAAKHIDKSKLREWKDDD